MKKTLILLLASLSTGLVCCGGEPPKVSELDRFGGWKTKSFEATGFFRTEHDGERWWIMSWIFDTERAGTPIPPGYLPLQPR